MATDPPRLILDVTRLLARTGPRVLTGIDRVERAYLRELRARDPQALLAAETRAGLLLLGPEAGERLSAWFDRPAEAPRPGPVLSRIAGGRAWRAAALAAVWPLRLGIAPTRAGAARMLARALPPAGGVLFSVGHLGGDWLAAAARVPGLRRVAMLHDTIPLDLPAPVAVVRRFRAYLTAATGADLLICPSAATAADLRHHAGPGARPVVVPLGVDLSPPDPVLPSPVDRLAPETPLFLALGTIEPRKDQAFLLDLWQALAADPPPGPAPWLVLAGRVGAGGAPVAARAARLAADGLPLCHLPDLGDGAVAALLLRARALLAPSRAEGFGLPLSEAAARGVPVLATPLPATRERLGDYAHFLPAGAQDAWLAAIGRLCEFSTCGSETDSRGLPVPGWSYHFARVFDRIGGPGL